MVPIFDTQLCACDALSANIYILTSAYDLSRNLWSPNCLRFLYLAAILLQKILSTVANMKFVKRQCYSIF